MKYLIIFTVLSSLFSFAPTDVFSQTEKGSKLIGGSLGFNSHGPADSRSTLAYLNPMAGFFISDNLALGGSLVGIFQSDAGFGNTTIGVGPFVRYYIGAARARPFLEGAVSYLHRSSNYYDPSNDPFGAKAGLGVSYFITDQVGLEGILSYNSNNYAESILSLSGLNFTIGFQIYLGKKGE